VFKVSVDTTYENIFMVLVHIVTLCTNIKVAYKHVMIHDCSRLGELKILIKKI